MDPELAEAINEIAAEEFRQPNEQILLWICQAVESYRVKKRGTKCYSVGASVSGIHNFSNSEKSARKSA